MNRFFRATARNYRFEVELPATLEKPTSWELRLSEEGQVRWKNSRLNYQTELPPCKR
jgi:hypothetical protein